MSRRILLDLTKAMAAVLVACFVSACDRSPNSPRSRLLSGKRVVFMCQHSQSKSTIPGELEAHADAVTVIAPMWYDIGSEGKISLISPEIAPAAYLTYCREKGIAVLPVLRNFKPHDFLLNPVAIDHAVKEITELLKTDGFDGLTIDIEEDGADPRTREPMLGFIGRLYAATKQQGKVLCVTFNPVYWGRSWQGEELLQVCDWAFSMFYDYSGPWNRKAFNATAPYEWPERSRDVKRDVARIMTPTNSPKVIFGIPAYGNRVTLDEAGNCIDFTVAYVNRFLAEKEQAGATRIWDPLARTPRFEYESLGRRHIVWYEDAESYRWRMGLASELNAAGVGVWSIGAKGGLDDDIWKVLREYRSGKFSEPSLRSTNR